MSSNPNQPLQPPRDGTWLEHFASGRIALSIALVGDCRLEAAVAPWLEQILTESLVNRICDRLRAALMQLVRPKG